jgi:hypothetical protein
MPVVIRDAFLQARCERRPVVIGVPFDLQGRRWDGPEDLPTPSQEWLSRPSPIPPHPDDVSKADSARYEYFHQCQNVCGTFASLPRDGRRRQRDRRPAL